MVAYEDGGGASPLPAGWTLLLTFDLAEVRAVCHAVEALEDTDEDMVYYLEDLRIATM